MEEKEIKNIFNKIVNFYFKNGNELDIFIDGYYIALNYNNTRLLKKNNKDDPYYTLIIGYEDYDFYEFKNIDIINQLLKNIDNYEVLKNTLKQPINSKKVNI